MKNNTNNTDNLHYFENIHASRYFLSSRILYILIQVKEAFTRYKFMAALYIFSNLIFSAYVYSLLPRAPYILEVFLVYLLIAEVVFIAGIFIMARIGLFLARYFSTKLYIGIRDASIFYFPLNVFGLSLIFGRTANNLVILALFIIGEIIIVALYKKTIAVKKQYDLDIPQRIKADYPVDIIIEDLSIFEKRQIAGDIRNCLAVRTGQDVKFKLNNKLNSFRLGIGVADLIENYNKDIKVSLYLTDDKSIKPKLLFTKIFNPAHNYEEREWLDISLDLDWANNDFDSHIFLIRIDNTEKNAKNSVVLLSEPRGNHQTYPPKKIIFVIFDSVRSDHIGCYGYMRNTSPNIDLFSKDAAIFKNALVQGEWTLTSFMSFLTSLYPSIHGVFHPELYQPFNDAIVTLPQILRENGFVTKCFLSHKRLVSNTGFSKGFDSRQFRHTDKTNRIAISDDVLMYAIDTLEFHKKDNLFLMLHFFDSHQPCNPPSPYSELFDKTYGKKAIKDVRTFLRKNLNQDFNKRDVENLVARYDAEIYRQDMRFGLLIDYLKKTGDYEDALIIFTSDHGMLLGDHGDLRRIRLLDESLKTPLVVKMPKTAAFLNGKSIDGHVVESNIDIMPTVLELYGIKKPAHIMGKSLLSEYTTNNFAVSESLFEGAYNVSVRDLKHRYTLKSDLGALYSKNDFKFKEEELYLVQNNKPAEIKMNKCEKNKDLFKKYRDTALNHVLRVRESLIILGENTNA